MGWLAATVIDVNALLETALAAIVAGVGVTLTFSLAILGSIRLAEASRQRSPLEAALYGALALLGFAATVAAIAFGVIVMAS